MDAILGSIILFAGDEAPPGWALCKGQEIGTEQTALHSVLLYTFGGDGKSTFRLPNLQSKVPVHPGTGAGLTSIKLAEIGGSENARLMANNLPIHNHDMSIPVSIPVGALAQLDTPAEGAFVGPLTNGFAIHPGKENNMRPPAIESALMQPAGANGPIPLTPPYLALNYIICVQGIFPQYD